MNQAQLYSQYNGMQRSDINYVLDEYFRLVKWRGNDAILDVGCGSGDVTTQCLMSRFPDDFKTLVGVDLANEMVEFANEHHRSDERVDFKPLNIGCKDIPENMEENFDHIFSFYCLHWVQEQRQAMENLHKMLKPGGDMLLSFVARHPIFDIYERLSKNPKWKGYMKDLKKFLSPYHYSISPLNELEKLLKQAGFHTSVCEIIERNYTYFDLDVYKKSVIVVNPFLSSIPKDLHEDYLDDYTEVAKGLNLIENDNNNDMLVKVPYKLFVVYATKDEKP